MKAHQRARFHRIGLKLLLAAGILAFLAAPASCLEFYTSADSSYPYYFTNWFNADTNEVDYMDVVSYRGREIVFFTMWSYGNKQSEEYRSKLYYYTPGFDLPGLSAIEATALPIQNTSGTLFHFRTVVFNDFLYLFYTTYDTDVYDSNVIYYRTVSVVYGEDGSTWESLAFSEPKALPAGIDWAEIRLTKVMNGKLYVFFSNNYLAYPYTQYGNTWYFISSEDGLTFGPPTHFFTGVSAPSGWWAGGAVFSAPDASGSWSEKLMIAYCTGGDTIYTFFFDGESNGYGSRSIVPGLPSIYSVRLITGTALGYTDNKHAIQVFFTTPSTTSGSPSPEWAYIYHGEYLPSGPGGDSGTWSSSWGHLWLTNHEGIYCADNYRTDPVWAVLPSYVPAGGNLRTYLRLWYSRGSQYYAIATHDILNFRYSEYQSDILASQPGKSIPPVSDLNAATVLGVIEGPPPFPVNSGLPDQADLSISSVEMTQAYTTEFKTTWSAGAGISVSYGGEFGSFGAKAELSSELKYTHESADEREVSYTNVFSSYDAAVEGGLGWVLYLKPQILINPYALRSYSWKPLTYDGITDDMEISVITYGEDTLMGAKAFLLSDPDAPFGTDTSTSIFAGMKSRPLSIDIPAWQSEVNCNSYGICADSTYSLYLNENGINPLLPISGTQGEKSNIFLTQKTTEAETNGASVSFSVSASAFGFETASKISYSMDVTTKTSMKQSLGFWYNMVACDLDGSTCCISSMDVYPYILVPNEDDTGYDAPWISDDIRNYNKPKPWALSYRAVPSNNCTVSSLGATRISLQKANGTLFLDRSDWNRDRMTARLTLEGISPDFFLDREHDVHLRLGNYVINSERNWVVSRAFHGNHLILDIREEEDSDSHIRMKLSYNRAKSVLDIFVDADNIDLSHLQAYPFLGEDPTYGGKAHAASYSFHLGGQYFATGDLEVRCTDTGQNAVCNFHGRKE